MGHLHSLRIRLVAIVLLTVTPMFGLAFYNASRDRQRATREAEDEAARLASLAAIEEQRLFDQTRALLATLAGQPDVVSRDPSRCAATLARAQAGFARYLNIFVAESDGRISCSAVPLRAPVHVADRKYFQRALEGAFALGGYDRERVTGEHALIFGYPLGGGQIPRGVVAAAIGLGTLPLVEQATLSVLPEATSLTKVDADGRILAIAPHRPDVVGTVAPSFARLRSLPADDRGVATMTDDRGVVSLYALSRVPYSLESGDLFVIMRFRAGSVFTDISRTLRRTLLALGVITLMALLAGWVVATSTVERPFRRLLGAARGMAAGQTGRRIGRHGPDEFGRLAAAFDEMAEAIERRQHALTQSERRYRSLVDGAPYGIFTTDPDGRILAANPAFVRIMQCAAESDLLGRDVSSLYESLDEKGTLLERLSGSTPEAAEIRLRRKDGTPVVLRGGGLMVRDAAGNPTAYEAIVEDITAQRSLEHQLWQAQKLEAIGRLAGGIAHDFNNLLTVILVYVDLLDPELTGNTRADLAEIKEAALRAQTLTQQLLAFSRRQLLDPRPLNLNQVVAGMENMLRRLIGEDLDLVTALDPAVGIVRADRGQLEQVLMNLVVNARDAMPHGGRILIETANQEIVSPLLHEGGDVPAGHYVRLSVADTGSGMDAETRARIFEPFYTTKESAKGTGLGLATVYGIVRQSAGFIWVYSAPGKGATFRVFLPRVDDEAAATRAPAMREARRGSGERILVVEDDASVRGGVNRILTSAGYTVVQAGTAEEALDLVRASATRIDLLVTDVVLPGSSGPELAARLAETDPSLRVLYASGYAPGLAVLGSDAGLLQKPFTAETLLSSVAAMLAAPDRSGGDGGADPET